MSHGHDDSAHGHAHGHARGHTPGQGERPGAAPAGPAEFPPTPAVRHVTPAAEDFATRPSLGALLWPVFWLVVAVGIGLAVASYGWHVPAVH